MHQIGIDKIKKFMKVEVTGFFNLTEAEKLASDVEDALKQFKPQEAYIVITSKGFKPASQQVLPLLQKVQARIAEYGKKVAIVHDNVIAEMQGKRIGEESGANNNVNRFRTEEEAVEFLFE